MDTILIVGAGVVGARVALTLQARNFAPQRLPTRVIAWTRSPGSARILAAAGLPAAAAVDIAPPARGGVERLPVAFAPVDCLVLCAAPRARAVGGDRVLGSALPQDAQAVYVDGYARVLAALENSPRPPRRIVLVGSTGVIGDQAGATVDESVARDNASARGKVLCTAEDLVRDFVNRHAAGGASAVILRLVGLYGPERNPLAALKAQRYRYPGDPQKGINLLHVSDAAAAVVAAVDLLLPAGATEVFHCSDGGFPTRREYVEGICRRYELPVPAEPAPAPVSADAEKTARGVGDRRIGNDKMRARLLNELAFPTWVAGIESFEL